MVAAAHPQQLYKQNELAISVAHELATTDHRRLGRISVRGLYCGFVELDGVVSSYYAKSLALQIARSVREVTDVVDLIRVAPGLANRQFSFARR